MAPLNSFRIGRKPGTTETTPLETAYWVFYIFIGNISKICAVTIFDPNYKPSVMTAFYIGGISTFFAFFLWMLTNKDMISIMQCCSCMNICVQGLVKYSTLIMSGEGIRENVREIYEMYGRNTAPNTRNFKILRRWSNYCYRVCNTIIMLVVLTGLSFLTRPLLVYVVTGDVEMMVPIWVPGVDETTGGGYILTTAYHVFVTILAVVGTIGADALLISLVLHMWPMCLIFKNMVEEINFALRKETFRDSHEMRMYLRNLIMIHQEICRYNKSMSNMYYSQCTIEINSNAVSLCTAIFCIFSADWPPAYFLTFLFVGKLLAYCFLGTIAELASDVILNSLVASKWYLLPVREQKHILFMMMQSQKPVILKSGFVKLNLNLFVDIMKSVYSVTIMLSETVESS